MKRLVLYDTVIALTAMLVWITLASIDFKVGNTWFLKCIFWSSLVLVFIAFPLASFVAFRKEPENRGFMIMISALSIAPMFIFIAGPLVGYFVMWINGGMD